MDKLGIEPSLLLAQVVNFFIIIVVLSKLLYKPILAMLEKRKKQIEEGLALTENLRQEEEKLAVKREKLLESARAEAREIIEGAKKQGRETEKDIVAQAHTEASEILAKARAEGERIKEDAKKDIRASAVALAASMAKRLVSSVLSSADQHKVIQKHLKELETVR